MIEIPDLDDLSLNNYSGFSGFQNISLEESGLGELQQSHIHDDLEEHEQQVQG